MAMWKVTLLFQQTSNLSGQHGSFQRVGGWTETWYKGLNTLAEIRQNTVGPRITAWPLAVARAALLPKNAAIVGQRYQNVDPIGSAQLDGRIFPGGSGLENDVPQMGMLCLQPGRGVRNIRRQILRGLPDEMVKQGELTTHFLYGPLMDNFKNSLLEWSFRARELANPTHNIDVIEANAVVKVIVPMAIAINDDLRIMSTTQITTDAKVGGVFKVTAVSADGKSITIRGWPYGATSLGRCRKESYFFAQIDHEAITFNRVAQRKVGRPFVGYRGRASRQR